MNLSDILIRKGYSIYCDGEKAYKYARDILLELVGGEITLLYSVGKKSWGSRPSKRKGYEAPQKDESWQEDEVSGSSDAEDDVEDDTEDDAGEMLLSMKRYVVHLLFPAAMYVGESLPSKDTVRFHLVHLYWYVESPVVPPKNLAEILCKTLVYCIMNGKTSRLLIERQQGVWPCRLETNIQIHGTLIHMDCKGETFQSKSPNRPKTLPTKRMRRQICTDLYERILSKEMVRDYLFLQSWDNIEETETFNGIANLPPMHIGWDRYKGRYYHFGYLSFSYCNSPNCAYYGNDILVWPGNIESFHWKLPFTAVDPEVSIPLFAYNLFSIIKRFIPSYPSRISVLEPYSIVKRKSRKLFFMALSGEARAEIADAYCGMFSHYTYNENYIKCKTDTIPASVTESYNSRVHDGVVILEKKYTKYQRLEEDGILQDACCLCLNAEFDQVPNEISLRVDKLPNKDIIRSVYFTIIGMIKGFVAYLEKRYIEKRDAWGQWLIEKMAEDFDSLYGEACSRLKKQPDGSGRRLYEELLQGNAQITWGEMEKAKEIFNQRFQIIINNPRYREFRAKYSADHTWRHKIVLIEGKDYPQFQKRNRKNKAEAEQAILRETICLDAAKKEFSHEQMPYLYLYAAVKTFCEYLKDGKKEKLAEELDKKAHRIFKELSSQKIDVVQVLSEYLSRKIEANAIICIRTIKQEEASGWYDSKKHLVYLSYESYHEDFMRYWNENHRYSFPYTKYSFQQALVKRKVLVVHESQKKGSYNRCQCRVVVDPPIEDQPSKQRAVLKVDVGQLTLSSEAMQQLKEMDKIIVPRRRKSVKNKSIE